MALKLYTGIHAEKAAQKLADLMSANHDVFAPDTVAVASKSVEQWLQLELARQNTIAAHIDFPFPARVVHMLIPDLPDIADWTWKIFSLLAECHEPKVKAYLEEDPTRTKRWCLAGKLAGLFDQYQFYRDAEIRSPDFWKNEPWQRDLFDAICPVSRGERIAEWITNIPETLPFSRLFFFGMNELPPLLIDLIKAVAHRIDVHFFIITPSDGESHSPLMTQLGTTLLRFTRQIKRDAHTHELLEAAPAPGASLLEHLQNAICGKKTKQAGLPDSSLQVVSCHSPRREVEVLHQTLLDLLDANPDLQPEDILITAPSIDAYLPHLDAVFNNAGNLSIPLRCQTHDTLANRTAKLLLDLLDLVGQRITARDLLSLSATPLIQTRFNLTPDDLLVARTLLQESHYCWGIDGQDKQARFDLPDEESNTLLPALARMALGIALDNENEDLFNGSILPLPAMTGPRAATAVRLHELGWALAETVRDALGFDELPHEEKVAFLRTVLTRFVEETRETGFELAQIDRALSDIALKMPEDLSLDVLCMALRDELTQWNSTHRLSITGGASVCPIRKTGPVPFRVVALLGMNENVFPRRKPFFSFDLLSSAPSEGDPCPTQIDRADLLTLLMAARSALLISCIGQDMHRTTAQGYPAVPVTELVDYIQEGFCKNFPIIRHPMQPFSHNYFQKKSNLEDGSESKETPLLKSYNRGCYDVARELSPPPQKSPPRDHPGPFHEPLPSTDENKTLDISLDDLTRFLSDSPACFIREVLDARMPGEEDEMPECEPFDCPPLTEYQLCEQTVRALQCGRSEEEIRNLLLAKECLPPGIIGTHLTDTLILHQAKRLESTLRDVCSGAPKRIDVCIPFDSLTLRGILPDIYNDQLVRWRCGKWKPKYLLRAWVHHLAAMQSGIAAPTLLIGMEKSDDKKVPVKNQFKTIPANEASKDLKTLIHYYLKGRHAPVPLFPETAFAYADPLIDNPETRRKEAMKKWEDGYNYGGEKSQGMHPLIYRGVLPEGWEEVSGKIMSGLRNALEKINENV